MGRTGRQGPHAAGPLSSAQCTTRDGTGSIQHTAHTAAHAARHEEGRECTPRDSCGGGGRSRVGAGPPHPADRASDPQTRAKGRPRETPTDKKKRLTGRLGCGGADLDTHPGPRAGDVPGRHTQWSSASDIRGAGWQPRPALSPCIVISLPPRPQTVPTGQDTDT